MLTTTPDPVTRASDARLELEKVKSTLAIIAMLDQDKDSMDAYRAIERALDDRIAELKRETGDALH